MLNEQIIFWINSGKYDKDKEETVRKNMLSYLKELKKAENNEPLAHIASMAESPGFETVMALMAESMDIMNLLMDYIQGIKV